MSLTSNIIRRGYRSHNLVSIGGDLSSAQQEEGLDALQSIISSLLGNEVGEPLNGLHIPTEPSLFFDYRYPVSNTRIVCNLTEAMTIYLPCDPKDGARFAAQDIAENFSTFNLTLDANGYRIEESETLILSDDGFNAEWFFRADLGDWKRVSPLAVSDEFPFPTEFDDLFISLLSLRVNPSNGIETSSESIEILKEFKAKIRARYQQKHDIYPDPALYRLSSNPFARYYDPETAFNRGYECLFP